MYNKAKAEQYKALVDKVKTEYANNIDEHKDGKINLTGFDELREVNLYTYWQGLGYANKTPDIKYLLVGQDWGNPHNEDRDFLQRIHLISAGGVEQYFDGEISFDTDKNIIELFSEIDDKYKNIASVRYDELFFTNFCLGYRTASSSGEMSKRMMLKDSDRFLELCCILEPEYILCLGKLTFVCVYETLARKKVTDLIGYTENYNDYLDKEKSIAVDYYNVSSRIVPLAHCGAMGTLNRNKGKEKQTDKLYYQRKDWRKIRKWTE